MPTVLRALIDATGLSRRKAFDAIRAGRLSLDGRPLTDPSAEVPKGILRLDGDLLEAGMASRVYLVLNKPPGYVSTRHDDQGRPTVLHLVPEPLRARGLHPVGRLDLDTSGLLLLTNDGDLTFRLTHPRHEVEKEYWLRLSRPVDAALLDSLRQGAELDGQLRLPLRVERLPPGSPFDLSVTIREGRKRQVRRMVEAAGARVTGLRRVREGSLRLGSLPEGGVRALTAKELAELVPDRPSAGRA